MKLTHSTVVIGWGTDAKTGIPYWLIRNSYGPKWGESGNFKIRRGMNDFGVEGNNVASIPSIKDEYGNWI
jgi:C1A family cysteine protease